MDNISQLRSLLADSYAIEREIGAGGMATVYLARDAKHDRRVALKVLKPELGAVLGVERFLSEIRVTANLQHPNLLPLFDSGEREGLLYYVMPYVEGETLRHRIEREKQLPVDDAVRLSAAIATALDYAHRHGVIHRDLKPENILLHDGQPLIADFGIALAISNAGGARVTQTGLSLGTPQYMSPEQATGDRAIDRRTDIYSLGALTYEMLAGEPPHSGTSAQAIIAKLMTEEPRPITTLRRSVPPHVDAAVRRSLEKLPADRFATAAEFADALTGKTVVTMPRPLDAEHAPSATRWKLAAGAASVVAIAAMGWGLSRKQDAPSQHIQFTLALPDSARLDASGNRTSFALSPDGSQLAYVGVGGLFVRRLDNLTPRLLVSGPAAHPGWSPDGAWVAYVANGTLRKVSVGGGASLNIADSVSRFAWGSRGTIVFAHNGLARAELWRVSADGGVAERFVHQARPVDYTYGTPVFLPDGDAFVVTSITARGDSAELAAYRMSDGAFRYLGRGGSPIYLAGLLFYLNGSGDALLAAPFDAKALRFTGAPVPVLQDFVRKLSSAEVSLSTNGTMAYLPGTASRALAEVDRGGRERVLPFPPGLLSDPRYSPDGRRLALVVGQPPATDVWIYDLSSQTMSKLTSNGRNSSPAWSPDGRRIAWMIPSGVAPGVYWRATDASDAESPIVPGGLGVAFTPDGKYALTGKSSMQTLVAARLDSSRAQTQIIPTFGPPSPTVTHDGRWMAFVSQASGRPEVYVRQLFGPGGQYQISSGGASEPAWNPRGGELFYVGGGKLISATIALTPEPHVVRRDTLFSMAAYAAGSDRHYDVSSDGQRFVVAKSADRGSQPVIAVGWVDEVRARVRTKR